METEGKSKSRGEVRREYYEGKRLCDRAQKPEQKTLSISEIPLYRLQMHVDHHPGELETFFAVAAAAALAVPDLALKLCT